MIIKKRRSLRYIFNESIHARTAKNALVQKIVGIRTKVEGRILLIRCVAASDIVKAESICVSYSGTPCNKP